MQCSEVSMDKYNTTANTQHYFWKWGAPVNPKSTLPRKWRGSTVFTSHNNLTFQRTAQHFQYFYPFQKRRKKNTAFQAGKRFLVLQPYSHFITLSSESPSTYTSVKSNPQQMLAVARDFLLHYFWTSPSKHWTNCTREGVSAIVNISSRQHNKIQYRE